MSTKKIAASAAMIAIAIPVAMGATVLTMDSANAAAPAHPSQAAITATASNPTPASGKAFTVSGYFSENDAAAGGHVVKVQAERNGVWQALPGAKVTTASNGDYRLKVILDSKGARDLRVVGVGQGNQVNAHQQFNVVVR